MSVTPQYAEAADFVRFLRKFSHDNFLNQGDREWIESAANMLEALSTRPSAGECVRDAWGSPLYNTLANLVSVVSDVLQSNQAGNEPDFVPMMNACHKAAALLAKLTAEHKSSPPVPADEISEEDALVHHLRGFAEAYPESVFTPLSDADTDKIVGCGVNAPIDRISASMGRYFSPWFTKAAERIEALESALRTALTQETGE